MKTAKVIPVYKNGDHSLLFNYQPIFLFSISDKLLERLMYTDYIASCK